MMYWLKTYYPLARYKGYFTSRAEAIGMISQIIDQSIEYWLEVDPTFDKRDWLKDWRQGKSRPSVLLLKLEGDRPWPLYLKEAPDE